MEPTVTYGFEEIEYNEAEFLAAEVEYEKNRFLQRIEDLYKEPILWLLNESD